MSDEAYGATVAKRRLSRRLLELRVASGFTANHVLAVEAAEGTTGMLARLAKLRKSGRLKLADRAGVLVKAPKPGQSRRIAGMVRPALL